MILVLPFTTKWAEFLKLWGWLRYHYQLPIRQIHLDIQALYQGILETVTEPWKDGIVIYQHRSPFFDEDESACEACTTKGQSSLSISQGLSGISTSQLAIGCWLHRKIPSCQRFWQGRLEKTPAFTEHYTANTRGSLYAAQVCRTFTEEGRKKIRSFISYWILEIRPSCYFKICKIAKQLQELWLLAVPSQNVMTWRLN